LAADDEEGEDDDDDGDSSGAGHHSSVADDDEVPIGDVDVRVWGGAGVRRDERLSSASD